MRAPGNRVAIENDRPRVDVRAKVCGTAKYTADVAPANMLHAKFIRFPFGRGEVASANVEAARAVRGVLEVKFDPSKSRGRFCGDRIGHVVAETRVALDDAIAALAPKFKRGPAKAEVQRPAAPPAASAEDAAALEGIYARAAAVVEGVFSTQVQTHCALETHGGVVDHRGEKVEAWGSTQGVFAYQGGLAEPCGVDASKITVHCEYVGGGFGAKFDPGPEGRLAAETSRKYKRPCRVMLDRREEHLDSGNRPGSIQSFKLAADKSGKLLGGRVHAIGIVGYQKGGGDVSTGILYDFGKLVESSEEETLDAGLPRAFRAPGHPQAVFAIEAMMDDLAAKLGIDPLEMRKRNEKSDRRRKQLDIGANLIGWDKGHANGAGSGRIRRGLGVAGTLWHLWPTRTDAEVDILKSGRVEVRCGVQDIGTGTTTVVTDVAADELGIDRNLVTGRVGNSDFPEGVASGGSATARTAAPAVRDAAANARAELHALVAKEWKLEPAQVAFAKGVFTEQAGKRSLPWAKACALMFSAKITGRGRANGRATGEGTSDGVQFAEVEVDTETGVVRVLRIVAVQACGRVVNRLTAENQVCGGVIQGLSYALFENRILDPATGAMVNPNLEWYKIAGPVDIPDIVPVLDATPEDTGVRPLGEPVTIPTAGAIGNAIANAIGARVRDLPMTPDRVLAALAAKEAKS